MCPRAFKAVPSIRVVTKLLDQTDSGKLPSFPSEQLVEDHLDTGRINNHTQSLELQGGIHGCSTGTCLPNSFLDEVKSILKSLDK